MKLVYEGKTKDVYQLDDGTVKLIFKDDVTGSDGVFDPGADQVGLSIEGTGEAALRITTHFFELLKNKGTDTHFVSANFSEKAMIVKRAAMFGIGLAFICRCRAVGSFLRRYGA